MADESVNGQVNISVSVTGGDAVDALDASLASIGKTSTSLGGDAAAGIKNFGGAINDMIEPANKASDSFSQWAGTTKQWYDAIDQMTGSGGSFVKQFGSNLADMADQVNQSNSAMEDLTSTWTMADDRVGQSQTILKAHNDALAQSGFAARDTTSAMSDLAATTEESTNQMRSGGGGYEEFSRGLMQMVRPIWETRMIADVFSQAGKAIYDAAAIAEGPAAHSFGTFTGEVDALAASTNNAHSGWNQFMQGVGGGLTPVLEAAHALQGVGGGDDFWQTIGKYAGSMVGGPILSASEMLQSFGILSSAPFGPAGPYPGNATPAYFWAEHMAGTQTQSGQEMMLWSNPIAPNVQTPSQAWAAHIAATQTDIFPAGWFGPGPDPMAWGSTRLPAPGSMRYGYPGDNAALPGQGMFDAGGVESPFAGIEKSIGNFFGNLFSGVEKFFTTPPPDISGCFPAGSCILMSDGSERSIESIHVGDRVLAYDGITQTEATVLHTMIFYHKAVYRLTFENGSILRLTDSHPIMTRDGWKSLNPLQTAQENPGLQIQALQVGDKVQTCQGDCLTVVGVQCEDETATVYNFTVDTCHTYYADGFLVHNKVGARQAPDPTLWQQLTSDLGGIGGAMPQIHLPNLGSVLGSMLSSAMGDIGTISLPSIHLPNLGSVLGSMLSTGMGDLGSISLPSIHLPNIGSALGSMLSSSLGDVGSINLPSINFSGLLSSITGQLSSSLGGIGGISLPPINFSGLMSSISSALSMALSGLGSMTAGIPSFASGVEGFEGGLAYVHANELISLPRGSSVYPMSGTPSAISPLGAGALSGGGGGTFHIENHIHLDASTLINEMQGDMGAYNRLISGDRSY